VNCSQHIPQRFEAADVAAALAECDNRIKTLEAEIRRLRIIRNTAEVDAPGDGAAQVA
jgi:hypothetical protein